MVAKKRRTLKLDRSEAALRRDSPAYRVDDDWEAVPPQAMEVVVSVRFDAPTARHIAEIGRQSRRTVSQVIRDWTTERLNASGTQSRRVGETPAPCAATDIDYEAVRRRYRPEVVRLLLVGESRPSAGTFFFLGNSNLFFATRDAFTAALGPMPTGEDFLSFLTGRGVWLTDIATKPVNRLPGRPRRAAVEARVADLAEILREANPDAVVAIKRDLESPAREAIRLAGTDSHRLNVLPFPLYQWRREYVDGLARIVRELNAAR